MNISDAQVDNLICDFKKLYGFFPSKVFCDINHVRATGIPKYLRNAPSIMESGGISPNRIMRNSVITNHVICVKVTGKGKLKSLIAYKTFSTFQIPV